ncbi:hypothetical protein GCM10010472_60800 [Pseudonocardia halophobica]|uniref:Uncharacterized protein n=1 Tax=Pseudonocardia halophobica TaxID=29401 RepID=A0A9W6UGB7_9PSEU|nr:hypothetical protein [Pseudonocardia halophobica]GLL15967.1 hypothetical protein GCM10017577_71210 [Pseudonocardia halophobica]
MARILKDLSGPRRGPRPTGGPLGRVLVLVPLIGSLVRRGPRT